MSKIWTPCHYSLDRHCALYTVSATSDLHRNGKNALLFLLLLIFILNNTLTNASINLSVPMYCSVGMVGYYWNLGVDLASSLSFIHMIQRNNFCSTIYLLFEYSLFPHREMYFGTSCHFKASQDWCRKQVWKQHLKS